MAQKVALGRGLEALLGDYSTQSEHGVKEVDIRLLDNNPSQPRTDFDIERLEELSESIKLHGIVQPILVVENNGRYRIVAGERRFRAARMAGLTRVPIILREFNEQELFEISLIENIQRENLNPIEEAAAIRFLMQHHDLTQEDVSKRLGKSRPAIANSVRLLNLSDGIKNSIKEGKLQAGHAKVLLGVKDYETREKLAQQAAEFGWSVRELEKRVAEKPKAKRNGDNKKPLDPVVSAVEEKLRNTLGTKVNILGDNSTGKIIIDYYSLDTLESIYETICRGAGE